MKTQAFVRAPSALLMQCAAMFGGAWGTSWLAGRLGWPVSARLLFEGRWVLPSWNRFPWADAAGLLLFMTALPLIWERLRGATPSAIGLRAHKQAIAATAIGLLAVLAFAGVRHAMGGGARLSAGRTDALLLYWLVTAVSEEVAFRALLQRRVTQMSSLASGLAVATLAFVLWHGQPAPVAALAARAIAGLAFGLLYHFGQGLLPAVVCHWAFNIAAAW